MASFAIYTGADAAKTLKINADAWMHMTLAPKTLVILDARHRRFDEALGIHVPPRAGNRFVGVVNCDAETFDMAVIAQLLASSRDTIRFSVTNPENVPVGMERHSIQ